VDTATVSRPNLPIRKWGLGDASNPANITSSPVQVKDLITNERRKVSTHIPEMRYATLTNPIDP
jgi:hypothetical protein